MKHFSWLFVSLFFLAACSDDDSGTTNPPDPDPDPTPFAYAEATDGDLSNDHASPSGAFIFEEGNNTVVAAQEGGNTGDVDYFTFTVPDGFTLSQIVVDAFSTSDDAFIGLVAGSSFPNDQSSTAASDLLGGLVYGQGNAGQDILAPMANLSGATGYTPPLASGTYSIWLNQTGSATESSFSFVVTAE